MSGEQDPPAGGTAGETDGGPVGGSDGEKPSEWERRRRLAAAFGEVIPEQTSDDAGSRDGKGDDWYREQVPPHHS